MRIAEIAEILAERAGKQFNVPFLEEMKDLVVIHRARILTNILEKKPQQKKLYSQSIVLDLEEANRDECAAVSECACEDVMVTTKEVPVPLKINTNPFDFVGSPGGYVAFAWTTFGGERYTKCSPLTGKNARYTLLNNKIYIFNDLNTEKIRVEAVWDDPRILAAYSCSAEENIPCYTATNDFVADAAIAELVIQDILIKELHILPQKEPIQVKADELI